MGQFLDDRREAKNSHDRHAVAVVFHSCIVGHLPHKCSTIAWYSVHRGGNTSWQKTVLQYSRSWSSCAIV